jgi:hypothetical protein
MNERKAKVLIAVWMILALLALFLVAAGEARAQQLDHRAEEEGKGEPPPDLKDKGREVREEMKNLVEDLRPLLGEIRTLRRKGLQERREIVSGNRRRLREWVEARRSFWEKLGPVRLAAQAAGKGLSEVRGELSAAREAWMQGDSEAAGDHLDAALQLLRSMREQLERSKENAAE